MTPETPAGAFFVGFRRIKDVGKAPDPDFSEATSGDDPATIQVKRPDLALVPAQDPDAVGPDQLILMQDWSRFRLGRNNKDRVGANSKKFLAVELTIAFKNAN